MGAVSAVDSTNVSISEYSNLDDDVDTLSVQNKLEISNEYSISETNIVNSHDDNNGTLRASFASAGASDNLSSYSGGEDNILSVSNDDAVVSANSSGSNVANTTKVPTMLSVSDTSYSKAGTIFKVTLKDNSSNALKGQKISLKVNGKTYSANTNNNGVASIKTAALAVGSYSLSLTYAGNSNYSASSLSKKVKVLSSVKGSNIEKYYGYTSPYQATFLKDGEALANTKVSFKLNGKTYTRTTNKNGVAKVNVYLNVGNYTITSTNPYSKQVLSNKIVVKKDQSTLTHKPSKTYIAPNTKYVFKVALKSKHNVNIKKGVIDFTYNGKTITKKANLDGIANITISGLSKGTYTVKYAYRGNSMFYATSGSSKLYVQNPVYAFKASDLNMTYKDGSNFKVTLKQSNNPLSNKTVKFILNGKSFYAKTNSKGVAKIAVGNLKPGNYVVKYSHDSIGSKYYAKGSNNIVISKLKAKVIAKNLNMKYKDKSCFRALVKDEKGNILKNVGVKFVFKGKSYVYKTDSKGIAKLQINAIVGYYPIKVAVSNAYYKSDVLTKKILVNGTKFIAKQLYASVGTKVSYSVKAVDGKDKPIKKAKITFTIRGKTYTAKTNDDGVAKVNLGELPKGDHKIKFSHDSTTRTSIIHIVNKVTLKQLFKACKDVNGYIEDNEKLPSKVKIGNLYYTTADFLYLVSKAIINLKSGSEEDIPVMKVANPKKPGDAYDQGYLYDYLSVARSIVKTAQSKGIMPNSVDSKVGTIGYKGVVFALSRAVAFYGDNGIMPAYTAVRSLSDATTSNLNSKNTYKNLAQFLTATTNCQVHNSQIKNLAAKLTKGMTSEKAKAKAIFNYVRDTISYSFYYDTRYGAVGTLNAGTGNCVDHAHLVVALSRAAGLPARYVHGTCTFSSGTYGHVWSQVLVGDTWTVADATSTRNSFGNVVNWNANSYSLNGYYIDLEF